MFSTAIGTPLQDFFLGAHLLKHNFIIWLCFCLTFDLGYNISIYSCGGLIREEKYGI